MVSCELLGATDDYCGFALAVARLILPKKELTSHPQSAIV